MMADEVQVDNQCHMTIRADGMRRCAAKPVARLRRKYTDGRVTDYPFCATHLRGATDLSQYGSGFEGLLSVERIPL